MPKVQRLPSHLVNQIAAGEVVERPASVVKELVENSLDAGATQIEVTLQRAGRELISIVDNGCGMSPEDALLALERHATSKIKSFEDLLQVSTMGFRGEAVPSIASISHFTLKTRSASDATGLELKVVGGTLTTQNPCAASVGTTILVEHLFYNVPARRKFLKADNTEMGHCLDALKALSLANLHAGFRLFDGRRPIFDLPAGQTLAQRIASLFGSNDGLLEVNAVEGAVSLCGLVCTPTHLEPTRNKLYFFINGRCVDSKIFHFALRQAYGATLTKGMHPAAFLFLKVPPAEIDVNVHPAKREVRFHAERERLAFLTSALNNALADSIPTPTPLSLPFGTLPGPNGLPRYAPLPAATAPTSYTPPASFAPSNTPSFTPAPIASVPDTFAAPPLTPISFGSSQTVFRVAEAAPTTRHHWRFLGQAHTDWALFSTPEGIAMLHIPAAQERVAFDRVDKSFTAHTSQALLIPALLQLDGALVDALDTAQDFLTTQGFTVAPFGKGTYRLEAIPGWLTAENGFTGAPEQLLLQELGAIADGALPIGDERLAQRAVAQLAAKTAHTPLNHPQAINALLDTLLASSQPLKTPSGAPTFWELTLNELNKKFAL